MYVNSVCFSGQRTSVAVHSIKKISPGPSCLLAGLSFWYGQKYYKYIQETDMEGYRLLSNAVFLLPFLLSTVTPKLPWWSTKISWTALYSCGNTYWNTLWFGEEEDKYLLGSCCSLILCFTDECWSTGPAEQNRCRQKCVVILLCYFRVMKKKKKSSCQLT